MGKDYKSALDEFLAALPGFSEQRRPGLTAELRGLLIAMAPLACDGLLTAVSQGPDKLKAIRFLFDLLGVVDSTVPTAARDAGNDGSAKAEQ